MPALNTMHEQLCEQSHWDFSDLRALYINCTFGLGCGLPLRLRKP